MIASVDSTSYFFLIQLSGSDWKVFLEKTAPEFQNYKEIKLNL